MDEEQGYQWVTFAIHAPEQPSPRCYVCGDIGAWLFLRQKGEEWRAWPFCDRHAHQIRIPHPYFVPGGARDE